MRVLVPKAANEQARWQSALQEMSAQIEWLDPWDIQLLDELPEFKTAWLNLDEYAGVICVSPTAARVATDALDTYWPQAPVGIHWLCNGPRTASVLAVAGLQPQFPEGGYTAEDVLALPQAKSQAGDKWLIVKGEGGRVTLKQGLESRGCEVTELCVYRRGFQTSVLKEAPRVAEQCQAIWLSSKDLGEALLAQNCSYWQNWPGQWWVSSARLEAWAQENNLNKVACADGATVDALKDMIEKQVSGGL